MDTENREEAAAEGKQRVETLVVEVAYSAFVESPDKV
jgi:hypothetical protein